MNIKKIENKNTTNEDRCFLELNFAGVDNMLKFIQIKMAMLKDLKLEDILLTKRNY